VQISGTSPSWRIGGIWNSDDKGIKRNMKTYPNSWIKAVTERNKSLLS
jgi:hypothetical protein